MSETHTYTEPWDLVGIQLKMLLPKRPSQGAIAREWLSRDAMPQLPLLFIALAYNIYL